MSCTDQPGSRKRRRLHVELSDHLRLGHIRRIDCVIGLVNDIRNVKGQTVGREIAFMTNGGAR